MPIDGFFEPLPQGKRTAVVRGGKFLDVEVYGTIYASGGELGDLDISGDLTLTGDGLIKTAASGSRVEIGPKVTSTPIGELEELGVFIYDGTLADPGGVVLDPNGVIALASGSDGDQEVDGSWISVDENEAQVVVEDLGGGTTDLFTVFRYTEGSAPVVLDELLTVNNAGQVYTDAGSAAAPAFSFRGDLNTGLYRSGADALGFAAGGTTALAMSAVRFYAYNIDGDTTGTAANVTISATNAGRMQKSTSARRYKSNIREDPGLADLELTPVRFHHDGDGEDYIGFIADDMPDEDAKVYDDDTIENYDIRAVVAILTAKVNRLEKELDDLHLAR